MFTWQTSFVLYAVHKFCMLLDNGGFCNGCITKRILLLQAFHLQENQYYADYDEKYIKNFNSIFYHSEIVKLDHFMTLSLNYVNTVLYWSHCKIHQFEDAPNLVYAKNLATYRMSDPIWWNL